METFEGLVYVKHGRIGSKSEGPDYYLQTWDRDYLLNYEDRGPWELDYYLEFFCRKFVEVTGELEWRDKYNKSEKYQRYLCGAYA